MAPYSLQTEVVIVIATVILQNHIKKEARKNWLFEKYNKDNVIIIDGDGGNEDDQATLVGFVTSHLLSEMDHFRDNIASLIQRRLENSI